MSRFTGVVSVALGLLGLSPLSAWAQDICATQTQIPATECAALVAFYEATGGPTWTSSIGWLSTATPCQWEGMYCDGGHVDMIILTNNNLRGPLPDELADLSQLRALSLGVNFLSGGIPAFLGSLSNLYGLGLQHNVLTGEIPPELGNLRRLTNLNLAGNALTGSIPPALGALENLEVLLLADNSLSGALPPQLGQMTALRTLSAFNNSLSGGLPPELSNLPNLELLNLSDNLLSGELPEDIGLFPSLRRIALANNDLTGTIPFTLGDLDVKHLDLSGNGLTGTVPLSVAKFDPISICRLHDNPGLCVPATDEYLEIGETICGLTPDAQCQPLTSLAPPVVQRPAISTQPVHPNPSSQDATFRFSVATSAHTHVRMLNVLGQVIRVLYDDVPVPHQEYRLDIRMEGLPGGVYLLEVRQGGHVRWEKMIYVK